MGDRAADRAPAARLGMTDPGERRSEERLARSEIRSPLKLALPHGGADAERIAGALDAAQFRDAHDIDDDAQLRDAHVEHRHECLAAGKNAGLRTLPMQDIERLVEALGAHIVERRGLHRSLAARGPTCSARGGSGP